MHRLRQRVEFRYLNLAEDGYPSARNGTAAVDLILCRNVMIYFDRRDGAAGRAALLSLPEAGRLADHRPSDPPLWDCAPLRTRVTDGCVIYQREDGAALPEPAAAAPFVFPEPVPAALIAPDPLPEAPPPAPEAPEVGDGRGRARSPSVIDEVQRLADSGDSPAAEQGERSTRCEPIRWHPSCTISTRSSARSLADPRRRSLPLRRVLYIDPTLSLGAFHAGLDSAPRRTSERGAALLSGDAGNLQGACARQRGAALRR